MKKSVLIIVCALAAVLLLSSCHHENKKTPNQDFYGYVNDQWRKEHKDLIESREIVDFSVLSQTEIQKAFINHFDTAEPADAQEKMLFDMYRAALDFERRNSADYSEMYSYLEKIEAASSINELMTVDSEIFCSTGFSTLISFGRAMNAWNGIYKVDLLPDMPYASDPEITFLFYQNLLQPFGIDKDIEDYKRAYAFFDTAWRMKNTANNVNSTLITHENLVAQFGILNFEEICRQRNLTPVTVYGKQGNVDFAPLVEYLITAGLDDVRLFMEMALLGKVAPFLSEETARTYFTSMAGSADNLEVLTKQYVVQYMMDFWYPLMELIFNRYIVPAETIQDISAIADTIVASYLQVVQNTTLYSPAMQKKLSRIIQGINVYIGLSDRDIGYLVNKNMEGLDVWASLTTGNGVMTQYLHDSRTRETDCVRGKYSSYYCYSQSFDAVGECYILAGEFIPPFYSTDMSLEQKYGYIGWTIGHELSHCWKAGTLTNIPNGGYNRVIQLYDGYEEYSGVVTNGEQVLSEAVCDIVGLQVALHALQQQVAEPDYRQFFESFAIHNQTKTSYEADFNMMNVQHWKYPLSRCRVNRAVANFDEFYDAYNVKPDDGMYVPEEDRFKL